MIIRLLNWLKSKRLLRNIDNVGIGSTLHPVHQEDSRDAATRARVNKIFDQQQQQMQSRAKVAHNSDCDVLSCTKVSCFTWEPDIIVATKETSSIKRKRTKKI